MKKKKKGGRTSIGKIGFPLENECNKKGLMLQFNAVQGYKTDQTHQYLHYFL